MTGGSLRSALRRDQNQNLTATKGRFGRRPSDRAPARPWADLSLTRWLIIEHFGDLSISFHHQPNVVRKGHKVAGE
jgi:hypothetical protein